MSLLREIQRSLTSSESGLGPVLLKLRLLASKLGLPALDSWVRYETEGYPRDAELPNYRILGVTYTATFSGPFGSGIKNAPVPSYLIEKFAGQDWTRFRLRQSIASIDDLIRGNGTGSTITIDASNLMLLLQGNVYEDYACNAVYGHLSKSGLVEVQNAVRSRVLELTIEMERASPQASNIEIGENLDQDGLAKMHAAEGTIHQIIYGNNTTISTYGTSNTVTIGSIQAGNRESVARNLIDAGLPVSDAQAFSEILASEEPSSGSFGEKAKAWLSSNLPKALNGTWKIGVGVASSVLEEAAKRYYGLS